jgi:hypothetical protein
MLSQVQERGATARPIAFMSKFISFAHSRYPGHRFKFFAMKWAICDKFHHWLRGQQFTVWMNNNPLTYILTKAKLDACEQRWVAKLAPYEFDIKYIPGPIFFCRFFEQRFIQPSALHHLTRVPYQTLLAEANAVRTDRVQDVFFWPNHPFDKASDSNKVVISCQATVDLPSGTLSRHEVAAVLH